LAGENARRPHSLSAGKFCRDFFLIDRDQAMRIQFYASAAVI
jgi:hypothetical protein